MKIFSKSLAAGLVVGLSVTCFADTVVVVHPSAGVESLNEADVSRLFLGKTKSLPTGALAIPINQDEGNPARTAFNEKVCKKSASQYKAYWAQLVFTGKGAPPQSAGDDASIKALVAANPNMIGYIDSASVDSSVKVVFKVP